MDKVVNLSAYCAANLRILDAPKIPQAPPKACFGHGLEFISQPLADRDWQHQIKLVHARPYELVQNAHFEHYHRVVLGENILPKFARARQPTVA